MLIRLLLALLIAAFALPAAAAGPVCHEAPARVAMTHHGAPPAHEAAAHVCVGCAPLADWLGARVAERIAPVAVSSVTRVARLDLPGGTAPALPPPRPA